MTVDFTIPEDLKMVQTLSRDFVKDQLIPLEKEVLGRESDLEGAKQKLPPEKNAELVKMAKEVGLWGFNIPEEFGGTGFGVLASCLVEEELARTVIPFNLGDVSPLLFECNEEQKNKYLLPLLDGSISMFLALLEPGKVTDPSTIEMQACKVDGHYVLNGKKIVFTRNSIADFAVVFAVTDDSKGIREGVTCFLIDNGTPGYQVKGISEKTGWKTQLIEPVTLQFENCEIPITQILGEENKAFHLGRKWLATRRIIRSIRCVGAAARLLEKSLEHAGSWTSFGKVIGNWPGIQAALAEMAIDIQAARLMVYQAAWKADSGEDIHADAAMCKVFAIEMLKRVADRAVMIKNGPGPVQGLPLEFLCRNILLQNIGERALDVQKSMIAGNLLKLGK
jgi:acyl-CoA dehydrogenase